MDAGTVTATTLTLGNPSGTETSGAAASTQGTLTLNGGTLAVTGTSANLNGGTAVSPPGIKLVWAIVAGAGAVRAAIAATAATIHRRMLTPIASRCRDYKTGESFSQRRWVRQCTRQSWHLTDVADF